MVQSRSEKDLTYDSTPDADSSFELVHTEKFLESVCGNVAVVGKHYNLLITEERKRFTPWPGRLLVDGQALLQRAEEVALFGLDFLGG